MGLPDDFFREDINNELITAVYKITLPIICSLGILGNLLSIVVLSKKNKFKSVMYIYLRGVAWSDLGYLLFTVQGRDS
jgi:hypothetical protein